MAMKKVMKKGYKAGGKKGLKALAASGPKGKAAVKNMGFDPAELKKGGMAIKNAMNGLMKAIKAQDKVMARYGKMAMKKKK